MNCANCGSRFNWESRAPRILACGHSFCHCCLSRLFNSGQLKCPTCDRKHCANEVQDITLNLTLLDFVMKEEPVQESFCSFHKLALTSFCKKCGNFTCNDCYDSLHDKELGCEEVRISSENENANLEKSAIVENLDDKVQIFTSYLSQGQKNLGDAKQIESAFKECLLNLSRYRSSLDVHCESLKDHLSMLESSKSSLQECASLSDFLDWCKSSPSFRNDPQTARNAEPLRDLACSQSIRKNFGHILVSCFRELQNCKENTHENSLALQGGDTCLRLSFALDDNDKMLNLFKEIHIKQSTKVRFTWPLNGISDKKNYLKNVYADIDLKEDKVDIFYKFLSYDNAVFTTTHSQNIIEFHTFDPKVCIWEGLKNLSSIVDTFSQSSFIGLKNRRPNMSYMRDVGDQWPVFAVDYGYGIAGLVLAKYPVKCTSKELMLIGQFSIGGNIEDLPENWKSSVWRLNSRV